MEAYNMSNLGEVDVIYKYNDTLENRPYIRNSEEAISVLKKLYHKDKIGMQEQFVVVFLNTNKQVIGSSNLFTGGIAGTVVDIKIVLATALKLLASGILISHNHPTGNLKASNQDIILTDKLKKALEMMDIKLIDHLIVSPNFNFLSFLGEGLI